MISQLRYVLLFLVVVFSSLSWSVATSYDYDYDAEQSYVEVGNIGGVNKYGYDFGLNQPIVNKLSERSSFNGISRTGTVGG